MSICFSSVKMQWLIVSATLPIPPLSGHSRRRSSPARILLLCYCLRRPAQACEDGACSARRADHQQALQGVVRGEGEDQAAGGTVRESGFDFYFLCFSFVSFCFVLSLIALCYEGSFLFFLFLFFAPSSLSLISVFCFPYLLLNPVFSPPPPPPAASWSLSCNVIMVEITYGGSIPPICHGACTPGTVDRFD